MRIASSWEESAAMPAFSPMPSIPCFTPNAFSASKRAAFAPETVHSLPRGRNCRRRVPVLWDGIRLLRLRRPADSSAGIPPDISAMRELRSGSISNASWPSCCLPIAPGPTGRARPFAGPPRLSRCGDGSTRSGINCHNPKVFAWMARNALISEQSLRHLEIKSFS